MLTHDNKKGPWCAYAFIIMHFQTTVHVLRCVHPRIVNMVMLFSLQLISDKTINPNRLGPLAFCLCSSIFTQVNPVMHCDTFYIYSNNDVYDNNTDDNYYFINRKDLEQGFRNPSVVLACWGTTLCSCICVSKYLIRYTDTIYVFKSFYPCLLACIFYTD